ncbi:hypothetical protein HK096_009926 [Nowakowskiella sp. JEL0078]|nr:hypothetical protein HK096_009926 [Nowakowskiella sp. JEL0078]
MTKFNNLPELVIRKILVYITDPNDIAAIELTNKLCYNTVVETRLEIWNIVYRFSQFPNPKKKECLALLNPSNFEWPSVEEEDFHRHTIRVTWPNSIDFNDVNALAQMLSIHSITTSFDSATGNVIIHKSEVIKLKGNRIVYQANLKEIRFIQPDNGNYSPILEFGNDISKFLLPHTSSENVYMCKTDSNTLAYLTDHSTDYQLCLATLNDVITAAYGKILTLNSNEKCVKLVNFNSMHVDDDSNFAPNGFNLEDIYIEEPLLKIPLSNQFELSESVLKQTIDNCQVLSAFHISENSLLMVTVKGEQLSIEDIEILGNQRKMKLTKIEPGVVSLSMSVSFLGHFMSVTNDRFLFIFLDYGRGRKQVLKLFNLNSSVFLPPTPNLIDLPHGGSHIKVSADGSVVSFIEQDIPENFPYFVVLDLWHREGKKYRIPALKGIWVVNRDLNQRYGRVSVDFIDTKRN